MVKSYKVQTAVWDFPVRLVHWLMVISFFGAYITSSEEGASLLHVTFGYTLVGLMFFRIIWGFLGTKYARFCQFVKGPKAALKYLKSLVTIEPEHHTGHNPAGALAILGLIFLGIAVGLSGFSALHETWGEWGEEAHDVIANLMLVLIVVHIGAVLASSLIHRESLIKSMITGKKNIDAGEDIKKQHGAIALVVLVLVATFWIYQILNADIGGVDGSVLMSEHGGKHDIDRDDD